MGEHSYECNRLYHVLTAYQVYFRKLAFEQLPDMVEKYLGEGGFRVVVEALADATMAALPGLLEAAKGMVEFKEVEDPLNALELHFMCHQAARRITHDDEIGLFMPRRVSENRVELYAEHCPFKAQGLRLASFTGIVVGVIRALGGKAYAISHEEAKKHLPQGSYAVWTISDNDSCKIIVERV